MVEYDCSRRDTELKHAKCINVQLEASVASRSRARISKSKSNGKATPVVTTVIHYLAGHVTIGH